MIFLTMYFFSTSFGENFIYEDFKIFQFVGLDVMGSLFNGYAKVISNYKLAYYLHCLSFMFIEFFVSFLKEFKRSDYTSKI